MFNKPLKIINFAVLLQQQRYIVAISFLFYLHNGLSLSDFLLFQSIFYFTGLIAEIPAGYIGDIFPRKNVLIFSYLLFMIRIIMWIIAPNYFTILAGEILYGLSKAFYRGVSDGYIYDYLRDKQKTNLMLNKYGKFNFFMSCGSAISCLIGAWLYKYLGFSILLGIELFCNSIAVGILFFLPQITQEKKQITFKAHINRIHEIVKSTIKNNDLNIYMLYGGILSGMTSIFVWNFQPFMKNFAIPVYIFGIVYFINHILRALGSLNAHKFLNKISLVNTGFLIWGLYLLSLIILLKASNYDNIGICISTLIFICLAIGIQMVFNVGNLSRIHSLIPSDIRATTSSLNSMLASLCSGVFLMLFKILVNRGSTQYALGIFIILFASTYFIIRKISLKKNNKHLYDTV